MLERTAAVLTAALAAVMMASVPVRAQEPAPTEASLAIEDAPPARSPSRTLPDRHLFDPYFLGWESEPSMDYGGRDVASIDLSLCRTIGWLARSERRPKLAAAWEVPFGLLLSVVQHEVMGHGGRAREFHLDPGYGAGADLSFYTTIDKNPGSNEVTTLLAQGGTEGDNILTRRLLVDLLRPDGAEGASIPLLFMAKIDLTLYALETNRPDRSDHSRQHAFVDQYEQGNDMAMWIVSRQAQRVSADPNTVWQQKYEVDFSDPKVLHTWRDMRATALWNFLDPAAGASVYSWIGDHLLKGSVRVRPPVLRLAEGWGLTASTRGYLGTAEVSRFLDILVTTPIGIATVYGRDLDSTDDRTYGWGIGFDRVKLTKLLQFGIQGDWWTEPAALERKPEGSRWNASAQVDLLFADRWGFSAKGGYKNEGFFPGVPMDAGAYVGFGLRGAF